MPASTPASGGRARILVVEDVGCTQRLVRLLLEDAGHAVEAVESGEAALEALALAPFDLVLMDLRLPGMGGLEAVRRLRAAERDGARLPVVALSADVLPATVAEALRAGFDDHLAKPFTRASLRAAVEARLRPAPEGLAGLNSTVADLARFHGRSAVEALLRSLLDQLGRLEAPPAAGGDLQGLAHTLKGAAGVLGFGHVREACLRLEAACRAGSPVDAPLREAERACGAARRDIRRRLDAALA